MCAQTRRRRAVVGAVLAGVSAALAFGGLVVRAVGAEAVTTRWETPRLEGDSLVVGVRWTAACDARGCPERFAVQWTAQDGAGVVQRVLDTVVTDTRSAVRVARPAPLAVVSVCVTITAERRGRRAPAVSACRVFRTDDRDPPPVDSVAWDSLGVELGLAVLDSAIGPMDVFPARFQVRDTLNPGTGVIERDVRPVVRRLEHKDTLRANARRMGVVPDEAALALVAGDSVRVWEHMAGYRMARCGALPLRGGAYVLLLPRTARLSREEVVLWLAMCRRGVEAELPTARVRVVAVETDAPFVTLTPWARR